MLRVEVEVRVRVIGTPVKKEIVLTTHAVRRSVDCPLGTPNEVNQTVRDMGAVLAGDAADNVTRLMEP
jgi:hypothetical protein